MKLIDAAFDKKQYNGVLSIIGQLLTNQVHDNYKSITPDWKTPDVEMLHRLTRDVWSFSAAKNYQELRDLTLALVNEDGKLRTFDAFKSAAQKICDKYNETWLQTEYNQAVAASQNAARWTQFTADKDDIPFIEYQTIGDDAVRASHALLDGIVRKVDDAFWATHYPPNGWGCRCEVIQAVGVSAPKKDIPNVGIPEMFRTNLAQTGLIYPKNHPYYIGVPKAEITKAIAYLPPENTFITYAYKPQVSIHPLHGSGEVEGNLRAIEAFVYNFSGAKNPIASIDLLPELNENDSKIKAKFYNSFIKF
jgi:SPP1 gp7 family putative phage head morphogenesis protein